MDFFNSDHGLTKLPPIETHITKVDVTPDDDGRRIRISLDISPFSVSPIIELIIIGEGGIIAGSTTIVEPPFWKQLLTMHIKSPNIDSKEYILNVKLLYPDFDILKEESVGFVVPT